MRLERLEISNFKLLKELAVEFSTDPTKPLTSIRAENGSGKTSLLLAMLWAFYGRSGLPRHASSMRLSSTATPFGTAVSVRVMIEFEHEGHGVRARYRLIRSVDETPIDVDTVNSAAKRLHVYRLTDAGEEPVSSPDAFLRQVVPNNLREVFFTNGDDVQEFMSGRVDRADRQDRVHKAIKALLGLDQLYIARDDIVAAERRFRRKLSAEGGTDLAEASNALNEAEDRLDRQAADMRATEENIARIKDRRDAWEADLSAITDIGDLSQITAELADCERQLTALQSTTDAALTGAREELTGEELSWSLIPAALEDGVRVLSDLADRGIIPGTSIEVVRDRLEDGTCFCGTPLDPGSDARSRLEHLIEEHQRVDRTQELLTAAHHGARFLRSTHEARVEDSKDFASRRTFHLGQITTATDQVRVQQARRKDLLERRALIDEERVANLTGDIKRAEDALIRHGRELAILKHDFERFEKDKVDCEERLRRHERSARLNNALRANASAAGDLKQLVDEVIRSLEVDHVQRVASLMSARFLEIVGSDPELDAAIFGSVTINAAFDIEVRTPTGQRLDFDAEINGASQRALTLSFIWALMEVAGAEAPRIIDTPLGMVAGAVKHRLTDAITTPPTPDGPDYQVVLLLTRSEIRDVEDLLDNRAGMMCTMSCSKDAKDLAYPWGVDEPQVKICTCTHRQSCRVCARTYDDDSIAFRDMEAVLR